jgi:quercetin dioxygenase-like cupin family protein
MTPVDTPTLTLTAVHGADDATVRWAGAYASYGGAGSDHSSTVVFTIEPGGRLGWHTDSTEETQVILAGSGELRREDGSVRVFPVSVGSVFVLPEGVRHDLANVGSEPLRAVAIFSAPVVTQHFDNVMLPPNAHLLDSPNASV